MKEEKLNTEDGSQFTVFYLNDQGKKVPDVEETPATDLGSYYFSVGDAFEKAFGKESKIEPLKVEIDDTIESDFVKDPVAGRIYKVKSLEGVVARFIKCEKTPILDFDVVYARMDLHGTGFLCDVEDLLKATDLEVEKYLEKSVDK